jgi:hypothetical protein
MSTLIKHAFLRGNTKFPNSPNNILGFKIEDKAFYHGKFRGEWQSTLVVATEPKNLNFGALCGFPKRFKQIMDFVEDLEVVYYINGNRHPRINLFNTIILDSCGVSSPIAVRETVLPLSLKIGTELELNIEVNQEKGIELPIFSECLLYTVLRGLIDLPKSSYV